MATDVWQALRAIVARRDGSKCCYCGVPTAATIEHVTARSRQGGHRAENLRLACPACNSRKGNEALERWIARRGWEMPLPTDLPGSVAEMVRDRFDPSWSGGYFTTGSTNSRLCIERGKCVLEVRPGRDYAWERVILGREDHERVVLAAYDFCRRHNSNRRPGHRRRKARAR